MVIILQQPMTTNITLTTFPNHINKKVVAIQFNAGLRSGSFSFTANLPDLTLCYNNSKVLSDVVHKPGTY